MLPTATLTAILLTFVAGFLIEGCCVFWVHYAERGQPAKTAIFSAIVGAAQVLGIGESIRDVWASLAFVAGYALGTYVTVRFLKARLGRSPPDGDAAPTRPPSTP